MFDLSSSPNVSDYFEKWHCISLVEICFDSEFRVRTEIIIAQRTIFHFKSIFSLLTGVVLETRQVSRNAVTIPLICLHSYSNTRQSEIQLRFRASGRFSKFTDCYGGRVFDYNCASWHFRFGDNYAWSGPTYRMRDTKDVSCHVQLLFILEACDSFVQICRILSDWSHLTMAITKLFRLVFGILTLRKASKGLSRWMKQLHINYYSYGSNRWVLMLL